MIEGEELRVINIRTGARYDVYIGRPSKWGNPFSHLSHFPDHLRCVSREHAIRGYELYIRCNPELMGSLHELKNMVLGCHCHPLPCHGDVLVRLVDELYP